MNNVFTNYIIQLHNELSIAQCNDLLNCKLQIAFPFEFYYIYASIGGTIVTFFGAIKYISCSACFVICMAKRCLIFLYWNNIGIIIIIITMMIFFLSCLFLGPPSGLEALRAARSARYGSGGTVCTAWTHQTQTHYVCFKVVVALQ